MAAYVIAENLGVRDETAFQEYRAGVAATVEQYGGRFLVRRGAAEALEGDWRPGLVIIEFPSTERARAWYDSPEYRPLRDLRQRVAGTRLTLLEGV